MKYSDVFVYVILLDINLPYVISWKDLLLLSILILLGRQIYSPYHHLEIPSFKEVILNVGYPGGKVGEYASLGMKESIYRGYRKFISF